MSTATVEKRPRLRCKECGGAYGVRKTDQLCPKCRKPEMETDKLPESYQKPAKDLKANDGLTVTREAPIANPDKTDLSSLRGRYRPGYRRQPIRTVHDGAHVAIMPNNPRRLAQKAYRVPAKPLDIVPEDLKRCVVVDGKVTFNGDIVTITTQDNVDARKAEAKLRMQQRKGVLQSKSQEATRIGESMGRDPTKPPMGEPVRHTTVTDDRLVEGDPIQEIPSTVPGGHRQSTKQGSLGELG